VNRKRNFDLREALDTVDYLAEREVFDRRNRQTGEWRISIATVKRVKRKLEASWWARKAVRKRSLKGVGGWYGTCPTPAVQGPQSGEAGFGRNPGAGEAAGPRTPSPVAGGTAPLTAGKTNGGALKPGLATAAAFGERDLPGSAELPLAAGLTGGSDNNTLARVEGRKYSRS